LYFIKVVLRDLGSSNGTYVDGKRLSDESKPSNWMPLKNGSIIDFGVDLAFPDSIIALVCFIADV
jgi:pSer/pThr/pTyr-binding forkhead associated (FHA) protein